MTATASQRLLELQAVDNMLDRLVHQRRTAPEHQQLDDARAAVAKAAQRRAECQARLAEIDEQIGKNEAESSQLGMARDRLQAQLRTVSAAREAEALMHEIDAINARRGDLDDSELAALEEQDQIVGELDADEADEPRRVEAAAAAQAALDSVLSGLDEQIAIAQVQRDEHRAGLAEPLLARYERLRTKLDGVAVARLEGRQCTGCHLDLSTGELEAVRRAGPDELVECPQCSRLLVR